MQEAVGLGDHNRPKRPRGSRPGPEPFFTPAADGCLVDVADADIAESREQMIPQKTPVQFLGAHLEDTITNPLLRVVPERHPRRVGIGPIATADLSLFEGQPPGSVRLAGE